MISLALKRGRSVEYDVALSFAGEDRAYVEEVAKAPREFGVKCFYDEFEQTNLWGKNLYDHLDQIYRKQARFTVMFISKSYAEKRWPTFERRAVQARAFADDREYILPTRFDENRAARNAGDDCLCIIEDQVSRGTSTTRPGEVNQ